MKYKNYVHWLFVMFCLLVVSVPSVHADWFDDDAEEEVLCDQQCLPAQNGGDDGIFGMFSEDEIISLVSTVVRAPIFDKTSRPRTRDALYQLPLYRLGIADIPGLHHNLFFNRFPNFTTPLIDQFSLELNEEFLRTILGLAQQQEVIADIDSVINLIPLLKKIGVDEHRVGWLVQFNYEHKPFFFEVDSSLHLAERNLFASNTLTKQLEETLAQIFGDGESTFDKKAELARIRFGLGDTRVRVGVTTVDSEDIKVRTGAQIIIPTVIDTLRDGHFNSVKKSEQNNVLDFLINDVRRLTLNPEITNNHFAFGFFFDTHLPLYRDRNYKNKKLQLHSRLSYDAFITARDNRLAMAKLEITPEQVQRDEGDPESNIIERFKQQYLIPNKIIATISPGDIFYWTVMLDYIYGHWRGAIGYDYFLQQREIFEKIPSTPLPVSQLRITDATAPRISSHKVMGELQYRFRSGRRDELIISAGGDITVASTNLSDDWSLYLGAGLRF